MKIFLCLSRESQSGELVKEKIEAETPDEIEFTLIQQNRIPLSIEEAPFSTFILSLETALAGEVKDSELAIFFRQMGSLVSAGLPVIQALSNIKHSSTHPKLKRVIKILIEDIEEGHLLSTCMERHKDVFIGLAINLIKVGETTGRLDTVFFQLADHYEYEQQSSRLFKKATRYPLFVMMALGVAFLVLTLLVFPQFVSLFESQRTPLPPLTLGLMALSDFLINYWWVVILSIVSGVFLFKRYLKTDLGKEAYDKYFLKIPVVGDLIFKGLVVRWCRTLAMMNDAGVPISTSLMFSSKSLNNNYIERRLSTVKGNIEEGLPLSVAVKRTGVMPILVVQMVAIAEETGTLGKMLTESAKFYQAEVEYDLANLAAKIEPLLTVGLGGIVLTFALGIFMPIWGMLDFAK